MTRPTLPGIIPGLLRRGSPVISTIDGTRGVLCHHDEPDAGSTPSPLGRFVADLDVEAISVWRYDEFALDLTDPTGRAHAAWWLAARGSYYVPAQRSFDDLTDEAWITIWRRIKDGSDLTDVQIDALRRVVLAVAGLEEPEPARTVVVSLGWTYLRNGVSTHMWRSRANAEFFRAGDVHGGVPCGPVVEVHAELQLPVKSAVVVGEVVETVEREP